MLFNDLLQQLLAIYHTNSARLSHDLIFANKFRTEFTEYLTDFLHIKEKDLFYIPVGIKAAITQGNPYPHIKRARQVANKPSGIEIELILESMEKKTISPSDAMSILVQATLLQDEWLTSLRDDFGLNINPYYLEPQNRINLIKALQLLSKLPSYFYTQAHYWQARKCDAVHLFIDVIQNISMPILGEIIILHRDKQISYSNPKGIEIGLQFGTLLEQITAPHLAQIKSQDMNPYDIFARYFWDSYFVHFYPNHVPQIELAKTALENLSKALNFYVGPLEATTNKTAMNIGVCEVAFEILLDPESSTEYIKGPDMPSKLHHKMTQHNKKRYNNLKTCNH